MPGRARFTERLMPGRARVNGFDAAWSGDAAGSCLRPREACVHARTRALANVTWESSTLLIDLVQASRSCRPESASSSRAGIYR